MIDRRSFLAWFSFGLFGAPSVTHAQQSGKVARIGVLRSGGPPDPLVDAFRQGLRELGYVEGKTVTLEYRWAEGREDRLPALAGELVALKVDVIIATATSTAKAAKQATRAIPIVMPVGNDPVRSGLVASLARPGGNITGLVSQTSELAGKRVQLLSEAVPGLVRVALLRDPGNDDLDLTASESAARSLGATIQVLMVRRPDEMATAFEDAKKHRAQTLIVSGSPFLYSQRARIVKLAATHRLPAVYGHREFVADLGGLMSYGADFYDLWRRSAGYVDKILKGAKPADLPIEQPTKFELTINLKTAKALGLTIPASLLGRADFVVQ